MSIPARGPRAPDEWEKVGWGSNSVDRLRIEGGWLYRHAPSHREPCMVFVPAEAPFRGREQP
jgi:hypothetical protein